MMELSIIIVNWNTCDILAECLRSVYLHLPSGCVEVIVVDNASRDGSQAMVRTEFPQTTLLENDVNRGFAAANNQALSISNGRYLLLLNSDTIILNNVLEESIRYLDNNHDVGVMGCRVLNEDRTVQLTCMRYPSVLNALLLASGATHLQYPYFFGRERMLEWQRDSERDVEIVSGCYMLVRREALEQVGFFDESFFFYGEEADWCRRFRDAGWKVRFAPVGEIVHLWNASGKKQGDRRDLMLSEGIVRFIRKHDGAFAAGLVWVLLLFFNFSHGVVWIITGSMRQQQCAKERGRHFLAVTRGFRRAWPKIDRKGLVQA